MVVPGPDWKPINVLLEPEIFVFAGVPVRPASEPTAVLELPVLLSKSALLPIAVLFEPVPSLWREEVPIAVLLFPDRLTLVTVPPPPPGKVWPAAKLMMPVLAMAKVLLVPTRTLLPSSLSNEFVRWRGLVSNLATWFGMPAVLNSNWYSTGPSGFCTVGDVRCHTNPLLECRLATCVWAAEKATARNRNRETIRILREPGLGIHNSL